MKIAITILLAGLAIVLVAQGFISKSVGDTEIYAYEVIKKYEDFELRRYGPAIFSKVDLDSDSYKEVSSSGFRILAGYIFGGNERDEKIAMTSPVVMDFDEKSTMKFMVPSGYELDDLPAPNHKGISFEKEEGKIMAAVTFGGWASDEKIAQHKAELKSALEREGIAHIGRYSYLGYNPPYQMTNRRNEVVVEIEDYTP